MRLMHCDRGLFFLYSIIKHGQLLGSNADNALPSRCTIVITDGRIESIKPDSLPEANYPKDATLIDASDCWVTPSFIDLCHYLREPGHEHKGSIESETAAAAAAGFTHMVCPPNTDPIVDTPAVVNLIQKLNQKAGYCHIYQLGAMTTSLQDQQLSEMHALKEAGCIGIYPGDTTTIDNRTLLRCMEYAATFDLPIYFRPLDNSLGQGGLMHEGELSNQLGICITRDGR